MAAGDWKDMLSAIEKDDIDRVKYYIRAGVNVNYQHPEYLTTPLLESVAHERVEIVKLLLESGADPLLNAGFSSDSPLKTAFQTGNRDVVLVLKSFLPKRNLLISLIDLMRLKIKR